ncbi:DivIVA domain-containing protein [Planktothrix sp. FACHB-1355]|uniref:DivIVA domain-containing protein n=1 Tax=Aerosakkonema funiforme FACHB-1375 TaxID=2949571 RepID=A0A926VEC7_9CYAN|nr:MULTISPECIES: DivIVA domain-containing protein [Oscillatoriales]MBD2182173.1 DivIVA domain-containing protein [Aerosakkonema funiforme FACHB-1375]MBD3561525.1 DivIVA domain-containing protein [Planktothrix sp. FACHB-1355]
MLRQDLPRIGPDSDEPRTQDELSQRGETGVDIQRELNRLEEMILDSPRIPLTRRTVIDEEQLLEQLDLIRLNLPNAFEEAEAIIREKEELLLQAEQYAHKMIEAASQRAAQILDETGIVRQAKQEAQQLWQMVQQECEAAQEQTLAEIERMHREAQQELEELRAKAIAEANAIQNGADDYAEKMLNSIEQHLNEMLRVVRNGRQQLQPGESPLPTQKTSPIPPFPRQSSQTPPKK